MHYLFRKNRQKPAQQNNIDIL